MELSGNKGEWSEVYALLRLLGERKIHAGDANLNKLDLYYPIISIIREESKRLEYKPNIDSHVVITNEEGTEYARFPMNRFLNESLHLLEQIKSASTAAFELPQTENFMKSIYCEKLKADSSSKSDIHIVIHDLRTGMRPQLGFSIKSQLGKAATLLNAGKTTNFIYQVTGKNLSDNEVTRINSIDKHSERMRAVFENGCTLHFVDTEKSTFRNNLLFADCCLPAFIAECLLISYHPEHSSSSIKEVVERVAANNPLHYSGNNVSLFYEYKMKKLLLDIALGMSPGTEWNGRYEANGGYIVVRKDGEIVCYHFYNRNDVEDYLYHNTRFEKASRTRHQYGSLYRGEDGKLYMKLNLQIRFKE